MGPAQSQGPLNREEEAADEAGRRCRETTDAAALKIEGAPGPGGPLLGLTRWVVGPPQAPAELAPLTPCWASDLQSYEMTNLHGIAVTCSGGHRKLSYGKASGERAPGLHAHPVLVPETPS